MSCAAWLRPLTTLPALFGLLSCSAWQVENAQRPLVAPTGKAVHGLARVCPLRSAVLAQAVVFVVRDNGRVVGATEGPSYFCYLAEPGQHRILIESDDSEELRLLAMPGRVYFLKHHVDFNFGVVTTTSRWLSDPEGQREVKQLPYVVVVDGPEEPPRSPPCARADESSFPLRQRSRHQPACP